MREIIRLIDIFEDSFLSLRFYQASRVSLKLSREVRGTSKQ